MFVITVVFQATNGRSVGDVKETFVMVATLDRILGLEAGLLIFATDMTMCGLTVEPDMTDLMIDQDDRIVNKEVQIDLIGLVAPTILVGIDRIFIRGRRQKRSLPLFP